MKPLPNVVLALTCFLTMQIGQALATEVRLDNRSIKEKITSKVFALPTAIVTWQTDGIMRLNTGIKETIYNWKMCDNEICLWMPNEENKVWRASFTYNDAIAGDYKVTFSSGPNSNVPMREQPGDLSYLDAVDTLRRRLLDMNLSAADHDKVKKLQAENNAATQQRRENRNNKILIDSHAPNRQLMAAYQSYIAIKKCYEDRKSYASVYITEDEYKLSRVRVKSIETALKIRDPQLQTDNIWTEATNKPLTTDAAMIRALDGTTSTARLSDFDLVRDACQNSFRDLGSTLVELNPSEGRIKKDF